MAAKLLHSRLLCTDINIKTLVNILNYDEDHVLITCKYFIKRISINNRIQVNSWVSKSWHPFTSGAIKDPTGDYIYGIINNSICHWPLEEKDIENVKKLVFKSQIKELVSCEKSTYILYCCGFTEPIETGIKSRKEEKPQIIKEDELILQYQIYEDKKATALLVQNKTTSEHFLYRIHLKRESVRAHIRLSNCSLTGSAIFNDRRLITLWSDGALYTFKIFNDDWSESGVPGTCHGSLKGHLQCHRRTKILELSSNHLALQGMNPVEEGGAVVLWDTKFSVVASERPLKMYRDPPLAWPVGGASSCSAKGLAIVDGASLVYVPVALGPSTVASMFGSRLGASGSPCDECVGWDTEGVVSLSTGERVDREGEKKVATQTLYSGKSAALSQLIRSMEAGAVAEDVMARLVLSQLTTIPSEGVTEGEDSPPVLSLVSECVSSFGSLPEEALVAALAYLLPLPESRFTSSSSSPKKRNGGHSPVKKKGGQTPALSSSPAIREPLDEGNEDAAVPSCPFSAPRACEVDLVLRRPFSVDRLSAALHGALPFPAVLSLLHYLHHLIASGKAMMVPHAEGGAPCLETVALWLSALLDANYHQLVMTSEVAVHRTLLTCLTHVHALHESLEASHAMDSLVERVLSAKPLPLTQSDSPYSIERLCIAT